jgi:hypothetical protein
VNKQHNILPTSPVDVFFGLATQSGDLLLTQDYDFLGFDGIAFIDSKEYNPTLIQKQSNRSLTSKVYKPTLASKKIDYTLNLNPRSKGTSVRVQRVMFQVCHPSKTTSRKVRRVTHQI